MGAPPVGMPGMTAPPTGPPTGPPTSAPKTGPPTMGMPPPMSGPPMAGPPTTMGAPPMAGPPLGGPPLGGPPTMSGPPMSGPPMGGPPLSGPPRGGPPMSGPPLSGPPLSGPPMTGPPMTGPPTYSALSQGSATDSHLKRPYPTPTSHTNAPEAAPAEPAPRVDPDVVPRPKYPHRTTPIIHNPSDHSVYGTPPAWSHYYSPDRGSASLRYARTTLPWLPATRELAREIGVPISLVITPLAEPAEEFGENPIPILDRGEEGPLRCGKCTGYVNPWVKWVDSGATWVCNLCAHANPVPYEHQASLDQNNLRLDRHVKLEYSLGSVEYRAPNAYLAPDEQVFPLCIGIAIDVSYPAMASGATSASINATKALIDHLSEHPEYSGTVRLGIATFDKVLHFYDLATYIQNPMNPCPHAIVSDIDDSFCPLALDSWCPPLHVAREALVTVLDSLPQLFPPTSKSPLQSCSGAAVRAIIDGLADYGGRAVLFQSVIPSLGEGQILPPRENSKAYGADQENQLLVPAPLPTGYSIIGQHIPGSGGGTALPPAVWYSQMGNAAAERGVSVSYFILSNAWTDLATVAPLITATGGDVFVHPTFEPALSLPNAGTVSPIPPVPEHVQNYLNSQVSTLFL